MNAGPMKAREEGHAILLAILLTSVLAAMAAAQFSVAKRSVQASVYARERASLRQCAESGIGLALHDLRFNVSGSGGKVGTAAWSPGNDLGCDGAYGTADEGEGDGIPTPGEPNVFPAAVGPSSLGAGLIVHVAGTAFPDVQRVVATAANDEAMATVSTFVRRTPLVIPRLGAVYVDPEVALDLKGNSFLIDGNDHAMDGTPTAGVPMPGISTSAGDPPGSNAALLLAQIPTMNHDQVIGAGGDPSLGESSGVVLDEIFEGFKAIKTRTVDPGSHTDPDMGSVSSMQVTHVEGDLHLSGQGQGAGVLLVDGSLTFTGQFEFTGLVIVRGDVRLSGGGAGVHVYGTLMAGQSFTAVESAEDSEVTVSGNAKILYSSEAIAAMELGLPALYAIVFWDDR